MSYFFQQYIPSRSIFSRHEAQKTVILTAALAVLAGIAGCGSNYRPTTTPITGTGPASQPGAYAFVISKPSDAAQGVGTVIDYSGDTVMATAPIGPGPQTFTINSGGSLGWSLNVDGTVSNIPVSTNLQAKNVTYSTLRPYTTLDPVVALFSGSLGFYALDVNANSDDPTKPIQSNVDVLTGSPDKFNLVVPVDPTPVTMVGVAGSSRYYAITQAIPYLTPVTLNGTSVDGGVACNIDPHSVGVNGIADGIEASPNYTVSSHIPLGVCPVYAVGSPDTKRVFVLNRGSDTISVINSQNNTIDSCAKGSVNQNGQKYNCYPTLPLTKAAAAKLCPTANAPTCVLPPSGTANLPSTAGPIYAEYNQITGQIVVANYDGNSISVIDVNLDQYGNDGPNFGTTYTIPVGNHPASVTVLADGTRAYVANQSDGTVTIVNLSSHTVEKTLPVTGHPRSVVSVVNSIYGKVYVASPDSPFITIIRTDQDIISTTVLVQGNALDVRITSPDAASTANQNTISRMPGAGQPCNLPPESFTAAGATVSIASCKVQDPTLLTATP